MNIDIENLMSRSEKYLVLEMCNFSLDGSWFITLPKYAR